MAMAAAHDVDAAFISEILPDAEAVIVNGLAQPDDE